MEKTKQVNIKRIISIITAISIMFAAFFCMSPVKTYASTYWAAAYSVKTSVYGDDYNSVGNNVYFIQELLDQFGYYNGYLDGDFGSYTYNAVYNYQGANGLLQDGIVGFYTWKELLTDGELSTSFSCRTIGRGYGLCFPESQQVNSRRFYFKLDNATTYTIVYF